MDDVPTTPPQTLFEEPVPLTTSQLDLNTAQDIFAPADKHPRSSKASGKRKVSGGSTASEALDARVPASPLPKETTRTPAKPAPPGRRVSANRREDGAGDDEDDDPLDSIARISMPKKKTVAVKAKAKVQGAKVQPKASKPQSKPPSKSKPKSKLSKQPPHPVSQPVPGESSLSLDAEMRDALAGLAHGDIAAALDYDYDALGTESGVFVGMGEARKDGRFMKGGGAGGRAVVIAYD